MGVLVNFRGIPTYSTTSPPALAVELSRQNREVDTAFKDVERERAARYTVRFVTSDTPAVLDEMIVCEPSTALTVTLPSSSPDNSGRRIAVVMGNSVTVFVRASGTDKVVGTDRYTMSTPGQMLEFYDDGHGNWWRT